jgi:hypothetical protein
MELDLTNAILILDEAHNIEDVSRDAGGLELDQNDLKQAADKFENMSKSNRTLLDERIIDVEHFASTQSNAQCSKKLKDVCQVASMAVLMFALNVFLSSHFFFLFCFFLPSFLPIRCRLVCGNFVKGTQPNNAP